MNITLTVIVAAIVILITALVVITIFEPLIPYSPFNNARWVQKWECVEWDYYGPIFDIDYEDLMDRMAECKSRFIECKLNEPHKGAAASIQHCERFEYVRIIEWEKWD